LKPNFDKQIACLPLSHILPVIHAEDEGTLPRLADNVVHVLSYELGSGFEQGTKSFLGIPTTLSAEGKEYTDKQHEKNQGDVHDA